MINHHLISKISLFLSKRSNVFWIVLILLLALLLRLLSLYFSPILYRDSIVYIEMAKAWNETNSYSAMIEHIDEKIGWIPPFSIYLIFLFLKLGFNTEITARVVAIIMGMCIPVIGYKITQIIFQNNKISLCAALFFAINPILVEYSIEPTREIFYLVWSGIMIYYICCGIMKHRWRYWLYSGIFCAFACSTRYESIEFLLYLLLYFFISTCVLRQYKIIKSIEFFGVFIISFVLSFILLNFTMKSSNSFYESYLYYIRNTANNQPLKNILFFEEK